MNTTRLKQRLFIHLLLFIGIGLLFSCSSSDTSTVQVTDLLCEYRRDPLGIDNVAPRLSWKLIDANQERGQRQSAFQILVASTPDQLDKDEGDVWDSGKINSDQSVNNVYSGSSLTSNQQCYWKARVWDKDGNASDWSEPARFTIGLLNAEDWKGEWIQKRDQNPKDHNWYRKNFILDNVPEIALIYVASFGYHEIYVNGQKVDEGVMNPVQSHLAKRLPYLTYDIREYLTEGDNVIGIWHAAGWTRWGRVKTYFKPPFVFKAQVELVSQNQKTTLVSDTSWKCKKSYSAYWGDWDILDFGGEIIDERLREDSWNTATYDDSGWEYAVVFDHSNTGSMDPNDIDLGPKGAVRVDNSKEGIPTNPITATLSAQMIEPQVKYKEVRPKEITENEDSTYLIDMGENYTGFFSIDMRNGQEGDSVTLKIADHREVISSWNQQSKYIFDESGTGNFTNRFNVAGGRWVTIDGLNDKPKLEDIKGYVITNDRRQISSFESSSELLNQIYQINLNTYIANTLDGILMDCPHRERRGWGEVTVAAMYGDALPNFESGAYMDQYAQFMADAQAEDGKMRAVINGDDFEFLMWMANSPITLWESYQSFGDKKSLVDHYPSMLLWMEWLKKKSGYHIGRALTLGERGSLEFPGLGDWCTPRGNFWSASNSPESAHFNNCVYAYMLECALKMAEELGQTQDIEVFSKRLKIQREATHRQSYDPATGKYLDGRQINQALALLAGVTPEAEREKVKSHLVDNVLYKFPYYDTGSSGQALYTRYFTEHGERMDLIYELLQDRSHPSYGYFLEQGKTVWPERWSAVGKSQIHTCYTGIGGYFIKGFGGIRSDPKNPGMQQFLIKPAPVGDLTFANTSHQSMYGDIIVNWKRDDNLASYHLEVPVNTTAKVYIPALQSGDVKEGGKNADQSESIQYIGTEKSEPVGNYVIYQVASGTYDFEVTQQPETSYPDPLGEVKNLATIGRMNASSMYIETEKLPGFEAFKANDENMETTWQANSNVSEWLEIEWVKPVTFNRFVLHESGSQIRSFKIQYLDQGKWVDLIEGKQIGAEQTFTTSEVTSTRCRLLVEKSINNPKISEIQIFKN
ncbi:glycoside hydrolase family 78 protein [Reichenbachiella ulvae]|uniref:alpha-L-rhamnosidase n=1 Tax=Reichenbachiella ulvae TaxID=2980104 RepID=A0ABT3CSJ8_9BACT|nr:glycoside hydrolase family 78 protein [Reichenbachiella ulvae]MCV9386652.1 glycoside hydrolase family 78 protein [Reichenbachiella ulvae]